MNLSERWTRLMANMGMSANKDTLDALVCAYSETHRKYHNLEHLKTVLTELDSYEELADNKYGLELALWFHDAVYRPLSSANEEKSAEWAQEFMRRNKQNERSVDLVVKLIRATAHSDQAKQTDEELISDIDIAILGQPQEIYESYAGAVRSEYRMIPFTIYRRKRRALLENFLRKSRIYEMDAFSHRYEKQARLNLNREFTSL